jgi:hypothetical protein
MGLDCFAVIAVTLQCQQQIEGLAPDFEHAGQHGPFHEIETSAVLGGCFHIRLELIDKRVELLGDLFGVALLSKFDDFHGGGLLAFVNRIGTPESWHVGRFLFTPIPSTAQTNRRKAGYTRSRNGVAKL